MSPHSALPILSLEGYTSPSSFSLENEHKTISSANEQDTDSACQQHRHYKPTREKRQSSASSQKAIRMREIQWSPGWVWSTALKPSIQSLRFLRHISWSWMSALLALALLILTAVYASESEFISSLRSIGTTPSRAILVLRLLSEFAGLLLAATISAAFEKLQWVLVAQEHGNNTGICFLDYLGLQPGVGLLGFLTMAFGRRVPRISSRVWGILRLLAVTVVPLLNVLIMSNVQTRASFHRLASAEPMKGYSIGEFNASLAGLWQPMTDILFSTRFNEFLADSTRAIDITENPDWSACALSATQKNNRTCDLKYFVPGGVENFAPWLLSGGGSTEADAFLAVDQQGYIFEFTEGDPQWQFDVEEQCRVFGAPLAAFALCLKNQDGAEDVVHAQLVMCPGEIAAQMSCSNKTAWRHQHGFRTGLKTSYRRATLAYSRLNGTILSHKFSSAPPVSAPIKASDLLDAFDIVLGSGNAESKFAPALRIIGIGENVPSLPLYLWWYFHGIDELRQDDPGASLRALTGLQSLLALPIYHCQAKDFVELRDLGYDNTTYVGEAIESLFPVAIPDTTIYPAVLRYDVAASNSTLVAYIAVGGTALFLCFIALIIGSISPAAKQVRKLTRTPFATLDFWTKCKVKNSLGSPVSESDITALNRISCKEIVREVGLMRVGLIDSAGPEIVVNTPSPQGFAEIEIEMPRLDPIPRKLPSTLPYREKPSSSTSMGSPTQAKYGSLAGDEEREDWSHLLPYPET